MQQRLCLAHALVHDPQVLLLDEPASGLDPRARVELRELLRELRALGKTILISSHILPELEELCTSVAIVDRGQVLAQGRVTDIERRLRFGAVLRVRVLAEGEALEAARDRFAADPDVASAAILDDGTIELGFRGDDAASARLLAETSAPASPVVSFARAASDLEELFLQVTAPDRARWTRREVTTVTDQPTEDPGRSRSTTPPRTACRPMRWQRSATAPATGSQWRPRPRLPIRATIGGIAADRRQGTARPDARSARVRDPDPLPVPARRLRLDGRAHRWSASHSQQLRPVCRLRLGVIGQAIFAALIMLETLQVVFLAPAATAGRDQPRAREADPRDAGRDADLARSRSSSASC